MIAQAGAMVPRFKNGSQATEPTGGVGGKNLFDHAKILGGRNSVVIKKTEQFIDSVGLAIKEGLSLIEDFL